MQRRAQVWQVTGTLVLMAQACAVAVAQTAPGVATACARSDFESVVSSASDALRAITQQNSPAFQAKLRTLKEKRGWSHEQFLADGARFVRDEKITAFDDKSGDLLARINDAGQGQAQANCAQLADLKANMAALVELQTAKWAYMFTNIDAELAR